jgi:Repeat of unknown function (DUF5648)
MVRCVKSVTLRFLESLAMFLTMSRAHTVLARVAATVLLAAPVAAPHAAPTVETVTVVEFYNASLDAYFISARPTEQAALDAVPAFSRTGTRFVANAAADATSAQTRVCRFYISLASPFVSSHFYGAELTDCALIQSNLPPGFSFEGFDFAINVPDLNGVCPAASRQPIYRAFRSAANGVTPNHRYTASLSEYNTLLSRGWTPEGVAYCTTSAHFPVSESARSAAVRQVAAQDASCADVTPFYYEIGDRNGARVSGSVGGNLGASTPLAIASASKWLYGAYVTQQRGGALSVEDIRALNFTSGHVTFTRCEQSETVGTCATSGINAIFTPSALDKFSYSGAHMQTHAATAMGLAAQDNAGLADAVLTGLGMNAYATTFRYTQPQPAGGVTTTTATYAAFLRKLLNHALIAGTQLNANAVCTNSVTCATALTSPFPANESPLYSMGHWVEDTLVADGAYSSAGAFGFYPWIEPTKGFYGVLARADAAANAGMASLPCGRKLRAAWATGLVQ